MIAGHFLAVDGSGGNAKVGKIPATYSASSTCPPACPFNRAPAAGVAGRDCFAGSGLHSILAWRRVDAGGGNAAGWPAFLERLARILGRRPGTRWRHNVAGDLAGAGNRIDRRALRQLVAVNAAAGARGFTYTHKPLAAAPGVPAKLAAANLAAVLEAIRAGFTVNASGNGLEHADQLAELGVPVATLVPAGTPARFTTPAGRAGVICPAQIRPGVTCSSCGLCGVASARRPVVGFLPHGGRAKVADQIARS